MKTEFRKGTVGNVNFKSTTANTEQDANKIKLQLEKQGYKVTIEAKFYKGEFVWFNICGEKEVKSDFVPSWMKAKCGDGCGINY